MYPTKDTSLSDVKSSAANVNRDVADLRDVASKAGRKVRSLYEAASEEVTGDIEVVTSQIRNKPVQSALIALGAGLILGALFRRS